MDLHIPAHWISDAHLERARRALLGQNSMLESMAHRYRHAADHGEAEPEVAAELAADADAVMSVLATLIQTQQQRKHEAAESMEARDIVENARHADVGTG